jgi:hypothetical protein
MAVSLRRGAVVAVLAALGSVGTGSGAGAGEPRIQVTQGLVSASLEGVPVGEAVGALRRVAGVDVVLPASVQDRTVTLSLEQVPLERFVRRLLEVLGVGGYALVYEASGQMRRLIVVESGRSGPAPQPASDPGLAAPATAALESPGPALRPSAPLGAPPAHAMPLVRMETTGIAITPRGEYDRVDFTVAGRDRSPIQRQFKWGATAYFDIVDEQGKPLEDGSYRYELVVVPSIPDQIRARMEAVRESPEDRARLERELKSEGWLPKEPLIQSGHFSITGGLIVDGSQQEATRPR